MLKSGSTGAALSFAAVVASMPATVSAKERPLLPTDAWVLDTRDESCLVTRNFADPDGKPLQVQIEAFGPGSRYKFTMLGEGLPLRDGRRRGVATIRYRFKPDSEWRQAGAATAYRNGTDLLVFLSDLSTEAEFSRRQELFENGQPLDLTPFQFDRQRAATVNAFVLWYPARDDTVVQLGALDSVLGGLHECARGLVRKWGYEPASLDRVGTAPRIQNPRELGQAFAGALKADKTLRRNEAINFRLDVDERGGIAGCTLQFPSQNAALGDLLCLTLRDKAHLSPALDAAGRPMAAPLVSSFSFRIG